MTLKEAAQIYVDLIRLEESLAPDQHQARQEVSALRSKYHDLFTQALRAEGHTCEDRFEATKRAFEIVTSSMSDSSGVYRTADGREYRVTQARGWRLTAEDTGHFYCVYYVQRASGPGTNEQAVPFLIGCTNLFNGKFYLTREDEIPEDLATLTIRWVLEEAGEPPTDHMYRGVFTPRGLRHRPEQVEVVRFGEEHCQTLEDVVRQLRQSISEARERGRSIGFHASSSQFWTRVSESPQRVSARNA